MSKLRVNCFAISLDGYGAGSEQSLNNPLGVGGMGLHGWFFPTYTFRKSLIGKDDGEKGIDNDFAAGGFENIGAWILGRNMFSPLRGTWEGSDWKGWWGDNPPYHCPVFVLTHHARQPLVMEGGTTFHFITGGMQAALEAARSTAGGRDVRLGGGVATIRQYLAAGLIDELHLVVSPVLLGRGEHLLAGINMLELGYSVSEHVQTPRATHVILRK